MSYFIVFQNKTYDDERSGGYLWSPKKASDGREKFYWSNMTKIHEGDIIFSLYRRNLVSVNIATSKSINYDIPPALDEVNLWDKEGWLVKVHYNVLENPVNIDENIDKILSLSPSKYSPFNSEGRGNQGYLFEIGEKLGDYLLKLASENNKIKIDSILVKEEEYIKDIEDLVNRFKDETEKERIINVRVGQGLFKDKLLAYSCKCVICGLKIKELLIASHCKPWKKSSNKERLDVNNGMLFCPTHDMLFDKGFIAFDDAGRIKISQRIEPSQLELLNINKNVKLSLKKEQIPFIRWHRENVFK